MGIHSVMLQWWVQQCVECIACGAWLQTNWIIRFRKLLHSHRRILKDQIAEYHICHADDTFLRPTQKLALVPLTRRDLYVGFWIKILQNVLIQQCKIFCLKTHKSLTYSTLFRQITKNPLTLLPHSFSMDNTLDNTLKNTKSYSSCNALIDI